MLQETSKTIRHYCLLNGFDYEQYVGVKRGHMLWQSAFNRVYMLKEMLDRGVEGWVFYLDADAFIIDMRFDLVSYLVDKDRYGAIFAGHIGEVYDVNSGGFAVNLSHPAGKALILEYHRVCEAAAGEGYQRAISWEHDVYNDQYLLYLLLKSWFERIDFGGPFLIEHTNRSYVNNGPFISQLLRGLYPTFEERLAAITQRVTEIMADSPAIHPDRPKGTYVAAGHSRLLTECGNKTSVGIFTTGRAGVFLAGPHARAEAGRHILRVFGRSAGQVPESRVVAHDGNALLSRAALPGVSSPDLLAEHHFELADTVHDLEVRMDVGPDHHLCVHAVQIMPTQGDV
jgi:hypothetical protein